MNNSLRVQELRVCQRRGHTCGSVFSGQGTEPAKTLRQGRSEEACLGPVSWSRTEGVQGVQVIYCDDCDSCSK